MKDPIVRRCAWLAAPVGVALTFMLGRFYEPMAQGEDSAEMLAWGYIIGSTLAGIVGLCLTGTNRGMSRALVLGLLLLHDVVNTGAFGLARLATIDPSDSEHGMEEFVVMIQSFTLGVGSMIAAIFLLFLLVHRIPDPQPSPLRAFKK